MSEEIEQFLREPKYQEEFWKMARAVGFEGKDDDEDGMRVALFMIKGTEIGFVVGELNEMFQKWQIVKNLRQQPIFYDLLEKHPESEDDLIAFSIETLTTSKLDADKLTKLIDKYESK